MSYECSAPQYMDSIYNNARRNHYPQNVCQREYNQAIPGSCCLKPSFVAQPFLSYVEPVSFEEYQKQQTFPNLVSEKPFDNHVLSNSIGKNVTRTRDNVSLTKCETCNITTTCTCNGCQPQGQFKRREVPVGVTFIPASSLPILDTYSWDNQDGLYHYDTPQSRNLSWNATYNSHLPEMAKFAFQSEKERQRLEYGIQPPFPIQHPNNIPVNIAPRYQPFTGAGIPQIPYNRQYLDSSSNCGCNQNLGSSCPSCTSLLRIYQQPNPVETCPDEYNQWMSTRKGAFCCAPQACERKFPVS